MNSIQIRDTFINVIQDNFPEVRLKKATTNSGNIRISPYVPNKLRNKRWMQLDANPTHLSIAMDHKPGELTVEDLLTLNLPYGLNQLKSSIVMRKHNDSVNISIFSSDPYDFTNKEFLYFLHKHYKSYLKRIRS